MQILTRDLAQQADIVITMGCHDQCPVIPGKRYLDWDSPTPPANPSRRPAPPATRSTNMFNR